MEQVMASQVQTLLYFNTVQIQSLNIWRCINKRTNVVLACSSSLKPYSIFEVLLLMDKQNLTEITIFKK